MKDQVLEGLFRLFLIFGEHTRVVLDEHFTDLNLQVRNKGVDPEAGLIDLAAENPEGSRKTPALSEELLGRFVHEISLLKEHDITLLAEQVITHDNLYIKGCLINQNVAGLEVIDWWKSKTQIKKCC